MFLKSSDKTMPEYKIANSICKKLKQAAAVFDSNNPSHKNGKRYVISYKLYTDIIYNEIENKNLSAISKDKVKRFIEQKLIPV